MVFDNIENVWDDNPNGSPGNETSAHLVASDASKRIGTAIMLRTMPGDEFRISADCFYQGAYTPGSRVSAADMVSSLTNALLGGETYTGVPVSEMQQNVAIISQAMNNPALPSQLNSMLSANTDPSAPQAYLNYLMFDQNLQLIPAQSGTVQVPTGGGSGIPWTTIRPSTLDGEVLRADVPGYIVIYINNNSIGKDVYFDDIKIEHYNGNVLEESHYYPYGLTVSQMASGATAPANPYKYQGIELERNFGLEQYETPNRGLNPQIGRFMQIDPMANITYSQSPYASMDNNPVIYTDPDGLFSRFGAWWRNVVWGGDGIEKNKKTGEWGVRSSGENWDGSFMAQVTYNGKPTAFPSQIKEHLKQQLEFEDAMQQTGIETKWVDNVGEARKDMLNFSASLMVGSAPQLNVAKTANAAGKVAKTTINSVEDLIASGTKMPKVKGATQLSVKGNADEIFNSLSKGAELIKTNQAKLPDGTLITKYPSSTTGVQTLQINQSGKLYKIRIE